MKKILLSTTTSEGEYRNWTTPKHFESFSVNKYMPLGILSLATNLTDNYEIKVIDPFGEGMSIQQTIDIVNKEKPDIFGLSTITQKAYAIREILRNIDVPYIAVGGPHATYYSKQLIEFGADAVFIGSIADLEFNDAIKDSKKGIIYCKTNINNIKYPKREFLNVKRYFPTEFKLFRDDNRLPMFTSIGCPNRCTFCNVQEKKLQYKNPKIIVNEMKYLKGLGCRNVHILDDNFNINRNHVIGILDEMDNQNFHMDWSGRGQTRMDLSLLERMSQMGFKRIHVGIEALDNKILKFFNKNETLEDIERFCKEANRCNIEILGYFIIGSPVETEEYRRTLIDKIHDLNINYPFFNILFPEPNTEYYNQLLREGIYKKDYWKEFMDNPSPNYELPYPYGEERKISVMKFIEKCIDKVR